MIGAWQLGAVLLGGLYCGASLCRAALQGSHPTLLPHGAVCWRRNGDGKRLVCLLFDNLKSVLLAQMGF